MMNYYIADAPMGSPPELSRSKSSKSSSFRSSTGSDDGSIVADANNFEEIGLDDEESDQVADFPRMKGSGSNPYASTYTADLRTSAKKRNMASSHGHNRSQRELTSAKTRPSFPSLRGQVRSVTTPSDGLGALHTQNSTTMSRRGFTSPSVSSLPSTNRKRSPSPAHSMYETSRHLSALSPRIRRESWHTNQNTKRKTALELEKECDEDDGDDLPDEVLLENVPMSPRPLHERSASSRPPSAGTSPDRQPKEKVRPAGNGTSPIPVEQGCLKSPRLGMPNRSPSMSQFPINHELPNKGRAKSWTSAMSALSEEAKALTAALEEHAVEAEAKLSESNQRRSFNTSTRTVVYKPRVKSAFAELPPLRRTEMMIDPLPISKEKEAVLSRTRPSWLPPKNPEEEKRHLREYQKMMENAQEADRKREAEKNTQTVCRDDTANSLLRIWEEHVLPNWNDATRQKRTRELWWRGIAPRSRGGVWARAVGNELELTESSYDVALKRAKEVERRLKKAEKPSAEDERKKFWFDRIDRDVRETYKELRIFQPDGPLHGSLVDVLKAYAMYRSDVGYVHGTSTLAAILLLNLDTPAATFRTLSNILNRSLPLSFHTYDSGATSKAYSLVLSTLKTKSPSLHQHLTHLSNNPDAWLRDIFSSLFTGCLSLDNATRLWDVMVFEGDAVLVRAGVAFLMKMEGKLFNCSSEREMVVLVRDGLQGVGEEEWMLAVREAGKASASSSS